MITKGFGYPTPIDDTCVLALDFNDNYPDVIDKSSSFNDGVITGAAQTTGIYGLGLEFNGSSDLVSIADANSLDGMANVTVMFWIRPTDIAASGKLFYKNAAYDIGINADGDIFGEFNSVGNPGLWGSSPTVDDGNWHHGAMTYDGSSIRCYIDGVLVETLGSLTGSIGAGGSALELGRHADNTNEHYLGTMDRVFLFTRALSAQEIQDEFDNYSR